MFRYLIILIGIALIGALHFAGNEMKVSGGVPASTGPAPEAALDLADTDLPEPGWTGMLAERLLQIDENTDGNLAVYVKNLGDNHSMGYGVEHDRYLASTTKIPIAVAILQKVDAGELCLDDEIVLEESHFVDGAGSLLWQQPGSRHRIITLMERMIRQSDNTATDMLFNLIGEEELNGMIHRKMVPHGLNRITSILQVRYDAFSEFHGNAGGLSNLDILYVNSTRCRDERLARLISRMAVERDQLRAGSVGEAFERYYQRGINSGKLEAMGIFLERLYNGELLSAGNTRLLLDIMESVTTGDRRIKAGLSGNYRFAHKTGTQIRRTVNVGIIYPPDESRGYPVIIAACVENTDDFAGSEKALAAVGRAVSDILLEQPSPAGVTGTATRDRH